MASIVESATSLGKDLGTRFLTVGVLPALLLVVVFGGLIAGGAPGDAPTLSAIGDAVERMSGADLAALAVLVVVVSLVLQPLQLGLVRLLEGYWPEWRPFASLIEAARERHRKHWKALRADSTPTGTSIDAATARRAAQAGWRWRSAYPSDVDRVLPTRLGNALRGAEDRAGSPYGLDTVVAWPRLYPLLPDRLTTILDDLRNQVDVATRLVATFAVGAVGSFALLVAHGRWWLLLPVALAVLGWSSYVGSVAAAIAYGHAICAAFDLHRFALLKAAHVALPTDGKEERALCEELTDLWSSRQSAGLPYEHGSG